MLGYQQVDKEDVDTLYLEDREQKKATTDDKTEQVHH